MSGLEIQTGKVPGTQVRRTPAPRPAIVGLMILGLVVVQFVFLGLVGAALWQNLIADEKAGIPHANNAAAHDPAISDAPLGTILINEQTIVSFWIAGIFFCMSAATFLYQRYFRDHVTIVKKRYRKWEDEGVQLHG